MTGLDPRYPLLSDLERRAKRRMPRFAWDYLAGGCGDETGVARNRAALDRVALTPRHMRELGAADLSVELFGRRYDLPIGMSPVGIGNMMWPGAEAILAAAAKRANIPYALSTFATTTIEDIAEIAGDNTWFQLYVPHDRAVTTDLIARAQNAGCGALIVTVDVPVGGKRSRDLRNGLNLPFRLSLKLMAQAVARPAWLLATARHGTPIFQNVMRYADVAGFNTGEMARFVAGFLTKGVSWERLGEIRDQWKGPLILKGMLAEADVTQAIALGVDGVILSNHGGRQFEAAPSPVERLPAIAAAANGKLTAMLDSGIRSGTDLLRIRALGAAAGFAGRPFLTSVGALGQAGADQIIEIFRDDVERGLAQLGCEAYRALDGSWLTGRTPA